MGGQRSKNGFRELAYFLGTGPRRERRRRCPNSSVSPSKEKQRSSPEDGSGTNRKLLREAAKLLDEAGCKVGKDRVRVCPSGDALDIEFLTFEATFERIIAPYIKNLQAIGVSATIRRVDSAQYQRRVKSFDFDVVTSRFVLRLTPGMEMRNYWASENANVNREQ